MKYSLLALVAFLCFDLSSQDCINWNYYRVIQVDNSTGTALTDYQIQIELNTQELVDAGKLRADGADLRVFANNCTPLPFWGDSLGTSTKSKIWVKVPNIPANSTGMIQIYYGNSSAESVADGDATFLFFDDFTSGVIDPAKWETIGEHAVYEIEDEMLNYSSTSMNPGGRFKFVRTAPVFSEKVIFDFVVAKTNSNGFGFSSADVDLDRILFRDAGFGFDTINQVAVMLDTLNNGIATQNLYPILRFDRFAFNTGSITVETNETNHLELSRFANEGLEIENTDIYTFETVEMSGFHFILSSFSTTQIIYLDNIRVRQATDNPPTTTVGAEEVLTDLNEQYINPVSIKIFPNPTTRYCSIQSEIDEGISVSLVDMKGREIQNMSITLSPQQSKELDLEILPGGLYYLKFHRLSDGKHIHSRQLNLAR